MNLTVVDIVKAHGAKLADACARARERIMSMDQDRVIPDEQVFFDSIIDDPLIDIPVSVIEDPVTIGLLTGVVAERLSQIEEDLNLVQDGRTYVDNEWSLLGSWKMELAQRGENNPVTMGARPVAMRTLALLQAERKRQDVPDHIVELKPSPLWAGALSAISNEAQMAQDFITEVVPNITQTEMKGDSTTHQFVSEAAVKGHPRDVMLEFAAGQVIAVVTIILDWDDNAQEGEVAIIDDNTLSIDRVFPQAFLNACVGKPLESVFDHEFVRGLGLMIEEAEGDGEQTTFTFQPPAARPLIMKDAPTNWWQEEQMQFD